MALPHTFVGGTKAKATEVNDNFLAVQLQRKIFSDATERTTSSATFVDTATTFALITPVGSLIIGITLKCEIKNDVGANFVETNLKIDGTNLGTTYLGLTAMYTPTAAVFPEQIPLFLTTERALIRESTSSYIFRAAANFTPLKILDATTNFTIRLRSQTGTQVRVKNVEIEVVYAQVFNEA